MHHFQINFSSHTKECLTKMNECSNYDNMQSEVDYSLYEAINSKIDFISKLI